MERKSNRQEHTLVWKQQVVTHQGNKWGFISQYFPLLFTELQYAWLICVLARIAVGSPLGFNDTPLISVVYLLVSEIGAVGETITLPILSGVYVYCLMCTWCSYGKRRLRGSPFISSLITVPTGRPHRGVFQMRTRSLRLHTTHTQPLYNISTSVAAHNTHNLSGCLSGRPDSGQLIFSSTDRLINTKTPHYSVFF